jgi:hypothetical protein
MELVEAVEGGISRMKTDVSKLPLGQGAFKLVLATGRDETRERTRRVLC